MRGKNVLITGAGSGLGREMAIYYAQLGARVVVADLLVERAEQTLALLSAGDHFAVEIDVAQVQMWTALAARLKSELGSLHVLINNAGIASSGDFLDTTEHEWDRVIAINLTSVQHGCKSMLPLMLGQRGGVIINTASFAGLAAAPDTGIYGVAKAAVVAYSEILRGQVYARGIHVACLCPSFFKTQLLESFSPGHDRMRKAASQLMERSDITATDVAKFAVDRAHAGDFLLLPHKESRTRWRMKRWLPEFYFKKMLQMVKRDK